MDHPAHTADFEADKNGLFKTYFDFCDQENDGVLTKADDQSCKTRLKDMILDRVEKWVFRVFIARKQAFSEYNYEIDDEIMAQLEQYEGMMSAFGEQVFNEFIDSDHDGAATLEEIQFVSWQAFDIFRVSNFLQNWIVF